MKHVEGKDKGSVVLYAISTCPRCKKTKRFLNQLNIAYDYVDVDTLESEEKEQIKQEVKECNPRQTFPTLKINGECVIGLQQDRIKEELRI